MGNVVFTFAKGRFVEKALLPTGSDNLVVVLLQTTGLPADATLKNFQTLAAVITGGAVEGTFTNYARKVLAAVDITVAFNTGTSVASVDIADQVWTAAGGATNNTLGKLLLCYRPTSGSLDSAVLPLTAHDFTATTTGGNLTATIPSIGTAT